LFALLAVSVQLGQGQRVPPSLKQQQEQLKQDYQNLANENAAIAEDAKTQIRQILARLGDQVTKYAVDLPLVLEDPMTFAVQHIEKVLGMSSVPIDPTSLAVRFGEKEAEKLLGVYEDSVRSGESDELRSALLHDVRDSLDLPGLLSGEIPKSLKTMVSDAVGAVLTDPDVWQGAIDNYAAKALRDRMTALQQQQQALDVRAALIKSEIIDASTTATITDLPVSPSLADLLRELDDTLADFPIHLDPLPETPSADGTNLDGAINHNTTNELGSKNPYLPDSLIPTADTNDSWAQGFQGLSQIAKLFHEPTSGNGVTPAMLAAMDAWLKQVTRSTAAANQALAAAANSSACQRICILYNKDGACAEYEYRSPAECSRLYSVFTGNWNSALNSSPPTLGSAPVSSSPVASQVSPQSNACHPPMFMGSNVLALASKYPSVAAVLQASTSPGCPLGWSRAQGTSAGAGAASVTPKAATVAPATAKNSPVPWTNGTSGQSTYADSLSIIRQAQSIQRVQPNNQGASAATVLTPGGITTEGVQSYTNTPGLGAQANKAETDSERASHKGK
jgi:hypothetical protein